MTDQGRPEAEVPPGRPVGERRLLPSLTVLVLILLPFGLPDRLTGWTKWVLGGMEIVLLVAIVIADPGRIDRRSGLLRGLSVALTFLLLTAASVATIDLVLDLVRGDSKFSAAGPLLVTGGLVWLDANLTFSLLYWELDGGGPAQRLHQVRAYPDLAFPQHINPDLSPPGWRPTFVDYMYLGLTNALAFSPTDVMPMVHWSKLTMAAQSLISLVILSLVIASAVNILG
jgi:hypothetical protein